MTVRVLDPTSLLGDDNPGPGPLLDTVSGRRIGIRLDILWPSWDWLADEWARLLEADGATIVRWRAAGRVNNEGDEVLEELRKFVGSGLDACLVGLANCGSCTSWTIHDALAADAAGLPTVAAVTEQFMDLASALTRRSGRSGLRIQQLPYPLHTLPEENVRDVARQQYRSLLRTFGVRGELADQSAP